MKEHGTNPVILGRVGNGLTKNARNAASADMNSKDKLHAKCYSAGRSQGDQSDRT